MKDIMETIFNRVFSFTGFMAVFCILILLIVASIIEQENIAKALNQATTKACYDGGLIKVNTDAGFYCVAPVNLVKVEVK